MKPCADVPDAPTPDVKTLLGRWAQNHSLREYDFFVALWCALEQQGFSDIRLRQEPYEVPHNLWRFSAKRGVSHCTFVAVERALRHAARAWATNRARTRWPRWCAGRVRQECSFSRSGRCSQNAAAKTQGSLACVDVALPLTRRRVARDRNCKPINSTRARKSFYGTGVSPEHFCAV